MQKYDVHVFTCERSTSSKGRCMLKTFMNCENVVVFFILAGSISVYTHT